MPRNTMKSVHKSIRQPAASKFDCGTSSLPVDLQSLALRPPRTVQLLPDARFVWYFWGEPGTAVEISLTRRQNSGGHFHPAGPVGTLSTTRFTLGPRYPQNYPVNYVAPEASGIIEMTSRFSNGIVRDIHQVMVPNLVPLTASAEILLIGSNARHPQNHFGTQSLVDSIRQLGREFHQRLGKPIEVNDMSLVWGGLFDHRSTWAPPHQTHREGRTADIRSRNMTSAEKTFFRETAVRLGFSVSLETSPQHWHLYK